MSGHFLTILTVVLLVALAWRFCKALAWRPAEVAYKEEFRRTRQIVLMRDRRRCQYPGCTRSGAGMHVHHIRERQYGGSNDPGNLITYCPEHHQLIHGRRF